MSRSAPPLIRDVVGMKMNETKKTLFQLLPALAFGTAALAAVHMLTLVWLVALVYRDDIRGYVPAGLTGLLILGVASLILFANLTAVARRRRDRAAPYAFGGCLAVPAAVLGVSVYAGLLIPFLGRYSWQKDVAINSVGGVLCTVLAIVFWRLWLSKKADSHAPEDAARKFADPHRDAR